MLRKNNLQLPFFFEIKAAAKRSEDDYL